LVFKAQSDLPAALTIQTLNQGIAYLAEVDGDLGRIVDEIGPPPMWAREPGFPTLVHVILEQQVSLASAQAAFSKLLESVSPLTPEEFLRQDPGELKRIGFSRQKASYCQGLAKAILNGDLDLGRLRAMDDSSARLELMKVRGIGPWTADIYLLMVLLRPDVWPVGDIALATAIQQVKGLPSRPDEEAVELFAEEWKPWRAVAARILWHHYLNRRKG
jgi:DNA-3-methyladenine glycosylase II